LSPSLRLREARGWGFQSSIKLFATIMVQSTCAAGREKERRLPWNCPAVVRKDYLRFVTGYFSFANRAASLNNEGTDICEQEQQPRENRNHRRMRWNRG